MRKSILSAALLLPCMATPIFAEVPTKKMSEILNSQPRLEIQASETAEPLIQIALLLDTSGSMKGLVDQARYQLWNVVSDLAAAKRGDDPIRLQIAVYQYGTELVAMSDGCLRQIVPFTDNLDEVSRGLFSLTVAGGDEYCGQAIQLAVDELGWNASSDVYKAVFIAGNEYFDQGTTPFGEILPSLKEKSIFLNTVYCGTKYEGRSQWDLAAKLAGGTSALIDHNHHLPSMPTPFDKRMRELNKEMNDTFVWYGEQGKKAQKNQQQQDRNAAEMSDHAFAARMSAKIGHLYHHIHNDLVDALMHKHVDLDKMPVSQMPETLQDMSPSDRVDFMEEMIERRSGVRRKMADVLSKRLRFLEDQHKKQNENSKHVLGSALGKTIRDQAKGLGYRFETMNPSLARKSP